MEVTEQVNLKQMDFSQFIVKIDQGESSYQKQIKRLQKEFGSYDKNEIVFILEYCEYDLELTKLILGRHKPHNLRVQIKNSLKDHKKGHLIMVNYIKQFKQENLNDEFQKSLKKEESDIQDQDKVNDLENFQQLVQQQECRLLQLPNKLIIDIMRFLYPKEIIRLGFCSKYLSAISQSKLIFKQIVIQLYPQQIQLPQESIFQLIHAYMSQSAYLYNPGRILQAQNDIRKIVWNEGIERYQTRKNYYKQFRNWFELFKVCPRVRYVGYYMMKEKYLKYGERGINQQYNPIIEVKYYRYIRFFPDGQVKLIVSSLKLNKDKISVVFSSTKNCHFEFNEKNSKIDVLLGEFQVRQDEVMIKYMHIPNIFEYRFLLRQTELGKHDCLIVQNHNMRIINYNMDNTDCLYDNRLNSKIKIFKFIPLEILRENINTYTD